MGYLEIKMLMKQCFHLSINFETSDFFLNIKAVKTMQTRIPLWITLFGGFLVLIGLYAGISCYTNVGSFIAGYIRQIPYSINTPLGKWAHEMFQWRS